MTRRYKPSTPFATPVMLMTPTRAVVKGVDTKTFTDTCRLNCTVKSYGGTEQTTNDLYTVIDTAYVETWYRPDITSGCRIRILTTGEIYEILGKPENIEMRNMFMKFKVRAVKGGA